ncbi:hypothetical protein [Nostoc sp.]|uniref:hypothetical protein n=1 Tax=Nostoc sp. TaxID=1180 RepID=UPI002FF82BC5
MKSPEILSVSLPSWRYTSEGIGVTYVLNLSVWGEWGLGIGDWGLGIGDWGLGTGGNEEDNNAPCPITNDK